ncbi:GNAT family N-acetyltransferase [Streptomyces kanasensis]|uniref:GNAT family N-acetyltransferase n=1 Tax=Streptomyces kanasensis TaxID=936756 RepID=UPI0036FC9EB8
MDLPPRVIELDDLTLRAFDGEADLPELFRVIEESLEHLRPWMPWVAEHSRARTAGFLADRAACWAAGEEYTYAMVLDGALVGAATLLRHDDTPDDTREIGYWLHPSATGRGVATRAARALTEQALRLPGVDHVEIVHAPANTASGAVPVRLGFTERPRRPAESLAPGETGEVRVWRLSRDRAGSAVAADIR